VAQTRHAAKYFQSNYKVALYSCTQVLYLNARYARYRS
jgi:hypothetical protein